MPKFSGPVGFGHNVEVRKGVFKDVMTERSYFGDVIKPSRRLDEVDQVNLNLSVANSISIVADTYANENLFAMRYVKWMGTLWIVTDVDVQRPRLLLRLGGVYNGPRPGAPASPGESL